MTATDALLAVVLPKVARSWLAGWLRARLAGTQRARVVWVLAFLLLAVGIGVQTSVWSALPLWYRFASSACSWQSRGSAVDSRAWREGWTALDQARPGR